MPDTIDRAALLASMQASIEALQKGQAVQEARTQPVTEQTFTSRVTAPDAQETVESRKYGVAKSFERLARADKKRFGHLATNAAQDDPRAYLARKEKNRNGDGEHYVVSDRDLDRMVQALLALRPDEAQAPGDGVLSKMAGAAEKGAFGQDSQIIRKTLDTDTSANGLALMRTDVEPVLYEIYLRDFPMYDRIAKERANGLVHTFDQRTATTTAGTVSSIGDFSGLLGNSTYSRQAQTNIAIIVAPTAIGLKLQFAVAQSGMTSFNLTGTDNLEVVGALTAIAKKDQALIFQGNAEVAANTGTASDENGLYDVNGATGLRWMLKGASFSFTKATDDKFASLLSRAAGQIINAGGRQQNLVAAMSLAVQEALNEELVNFYRVVDRTPAGGIDNNLSASGIKLLGNRMSEIFPIPAAAQTDGIGYYTFGGNATEDIYALDMSSMTLPWLGAEGPTILELPVGYNNILSRVYIPFVMHGLALKAPAFNRKIRVPQQTL